MKEQINWWTSFKGIWDIAAYDFSYGYHSIGWHLRQILESFVQILKSLTWKIWNVLLVLTFMITSPLSAFIIIWIRKKNEEYNKAAEAAARRDL